MYRARIALPILLGVIVALWGCTPPGGTADRALEARVSKLEKELKAAHEQTNALSAQVRVEQAKGKEAAQERDDARAAVKARGDELALTQAKAQADLESVRKGLKDLLGRVDAALTPSAGDKGTAADVSLLPKR